MPPFTSMDINPAKDNLKFQGKRVAYKADLPV